MLETLVAPRIRRTLFEYLLAHASDRFYLRGLAKDLSLPVSPLRRELKRLEQAGMLHTAHEGNMLFYTIEPASPAFLQLQQAGSPLPRFESIERSSAPMQTLEQHELREHVVVSAQPQVHASIPQGINAASRSQAFWQTALPTPLLVATSVVGMTLMLLIVGLEYLSMLNWRHHAEVPMGRDTHIAHSIVSGVRPSGLMRGNRWQIAPGSAGGFSVGLNAEPHSR